MPVVRAIIYVLLFVMGALAFFAPAVAGLIPAPTRIQGSPHNEGGSVPAHQTDAEGAGGSPSRLVVGFALGLAACLMALGCAAAWVGSLIAAPRLLVVRIAGFIVIALSLLQLVPARAGLFQGTALFPVPEGIVKGSGLGSGFVRGVRLVLGWVPHFTPLVLAALTVALSTHEVITGTAAVACFTAGIVFMLISGLLSHRINRHAFAQAVWVLRHSVHAAGAVGALVGFMLLTGWMNGMTDLLTPVTPATSEPGQAASEQQASSNSATSDGTSSDDGSENDVNVSIPDTYMAAPDFTLVDQYGSAHTLSKCTGDIVVITFWSSKSQAAVSGMGDYQAFYENILRSRRQHVSDRLAASASTATTSDATRPVEDLESLTNPSASQDRIESAAESAASSSEAALPSASTATSDSSGTGEALGTPTTLTTANTKVDVFSVVVPDDQIDLSVLADDLPNSTSTGSGDNTDKDASAVTEAEGGSLSATPSEARTTGTAGGGSSVNSSSPESDAHRIARLADASRDEVLAYVADSGFTFPVLLDTTGQTFLDYQVDELPTTYVLTTDGRIAGKVVGVLTTDQLNRIVQEGLDVSNRIIADEYRASQRAASTSSSTSAAGTALAEASRQDE